MSNTKQRASFSRGKIARVHTLRLFRQAPDNVDKNRIKDNVIFIDNLQGRTIEEFTNDEMQQYIDEYNSKQKRADRKITEPYTEWHKNNGQLMQHVKDKDSVEFAYEYVLCYGNHEDLWKEYFDDSTSQERKQELHKEAVGYYQKALEEFQQKYPHLKILYSVLHADEPNGSIHTHLCFQARAEYDKGLSCKVCIGRALSQDGIERLDQRKSADIEGFQLTRLCSEFRHQVMNRELEKLGYKIGEEEHGKEHIDSNQYTELMTEATQEKQEAERMMKQAIEKEQDTIKRATSIEIMQDDLEEIKEIVHRPNFNPSTVKKVEVKENMFSKPQTMIQLPIDEYENLRNSADMKLLERRVEEKIKEQKKAMKKCLENAMTPKEQELQQEVNILTQNLERKQKTIEEQEIMISQKNDKIERLSHFADKLEKVIEKAKDILRRFGLFKQYEQVFEYEKVDEFDFEYSTIKE